MLVGALPFVHSGDTSEATTEADEPLEPSCTDKVGATVWYRFTPAQDVAVRAHTLDSDFDTVLAVYVGTALTDLVQVDCSDESSGGQGRIFLEAQAGQTYFFQAGGWDGNTGLLEFTLEEFEFERPPNDGFPGEEIAALPFRGSGDSTTGSLEPGEPAPFCANIGATVWYSYAAMEDQILMAHAPFFIVAVYIGDSLSSLSEVDCDDFSGRVLFDAQEGETYFFQVGGSYGYSGPFEFHLSVVPEVTSRQVV